MASDQPQPLPQSEEALPERLRWLAACARLRWQVRDGAEADIVERLLDTLSQAGQRLEQQAERIRRLETLVTTDELTGLLNRRGFEQELEQTLAAAARHCEPGLLLLCDVDFFKQVNDSYGHLAGDRVLCAVAEALRQGARRHDSVARIGGDEFAVLMPRTAPTLAERLTGRLRSRLAAVTTTWGDQPITVSVSVGAEALRPDDDPRRLLFRADRALYGAKPGGAGLRLVRG